VLQQQQMPILGVQHQPGVGQHRRQVVGVGGSDQVVRPGSLPRSGVCMFTGHISGEVAYFGWPVAAKGGPPSNRSGP
jgi:hypothetical protein